MAINVNTVYTTVLSILNKEQRGYLTPFEFNQLGTQVQLEIFESYFENLNQLLKVPQPDSDYADRVKLLQEKISFFGKNQIITVTNSTPIAQQESFGKATIPTTLHRFGMLEYIDGHSLPVDVEKLTRNQVLSYRRSPLTSPTKEFPICFVQGDTIFILPAIPSTVGPEHKPIQSYNLEFVGKPIDPVWNYTVGSVGQYIFDPIANGVSKDFEISDIDQTELITKILMYAGVVVRDQEIVQAAAGLSNQQDQLELS